MKKYLFSFIIFVHLASADVVVNGNLQTPLFPEDNWWNLIVSNAPIDSTSDAIINYLGGSSQGCRPNFGADPIYGMPYGVVPGDTPLVMPVFLYASESDTNAPGRPPGYPIPEEAKTNQMIEGGIPGGGTSGDRHLLLVDQERRLLYDFMRHIGTNQALHGNVVAVLFSNLTRTTADLKAGHRQTLPGSQFFPDLSEQKKFLCKAILIMQFVLLFME